MSLVSTPIGSVGISAWPVRDTTVRTSGNSSRACSMRVVLLMDSDSATLGRRQAWTAIAPSLRRGRNSAPMNGTSPSDAAKSAAATRPVTPGRDIAQASRGR